MLPTGQDAVDTDESTLTLTVFVGAVHESL